MRNLLNTFVDDPFVEWKDNEKAGKKAMKDIDNRLHGQLEMTLPMSVEGQVQHIIQQATSEANLAAMFSGWMAFA